MIPRTRAICGVANPALTKMGPERRLGRPSPGSNQRLEGDEPVLHAQPYGDADCGGVVGAKFPRLVGRIAVSENVRQEFPFTSIRAISIDTRQE